MLHVLAIFGAYYLAMRCAIRFIRPIIWALALAATAWLLGG